jgi:RNA polymerase sigma-70 factor (sigma-E family)
MGLSRVSGEASLPEATPGSALAGTFREQWVPLVRLAVMLVDDRGLAEELVQEAFARTQRTGDRLRDPAALPAYLRSTVLNLARSRLRRRRVARRYHPPGDIAAASPEELLVLSEEHREVVAALRRLPERQRECVVLRFYLELSEAEIAAALGISVGSVKSHSHRAIAALAAALEDG